MQLDFKELTEISPEDIVKTYNELYLAYKWNSQAIILLWAAFKQALDWNPSQLFDFDNFLQQNSSFNKKLPSVVSSVKGNVDWVISFWYEEDVLKYIEDEDDELSKIRLIRKLCWWLWFVNIWWYNTPKSFMYFVDDLSKKLGITLREFMYSFPNLWMLINDIIPNWKINFLKWLDYIINTLFIIWNLENRMDNLRALDSSLSWLILDIYKREEDLRVKKEILSLMLISVWIYIDSKIFQTWDVLTEAEAETLKKELLRVFWDNLSDKNRLVITKELDIVDIETIIILVEELISNKAIALIERIDKDFLRTFSPSQLRDRDNIVFKTRIMYKTNRIVRSKKNQTDGVLYDVNSSEFWINIYTKLLQYLEDEQTINW